MATASVPTVINRESVGQAIRQLRIVYRTDERKVNAINKAEARLYSTLWQWDGTSRTLAIESATKTGAVRYHVEYGQCECTAAAHGRACWHVEAWEVLVTAETCRPRRSAEDHARILREVAELC